MKTLKQYAELVRATPPDGLIKLHGRGVTAKRLRWDLGLTPAEEMDFTPYAEDKEDAGWETDDLAGTLLIVHTGGVFQYLVGGQEADPESIRPA